MTATSQAARSSLKSRGSGGGGSLGRQFKSPLMQMNHYPNHILKRIMKDKDFQDGRGSPFKDSFGPIPTEPE